MYLTASIQPPSWLPLTEIGRNPITIGTVFILSFESLVWTVMSHKGRCVGVGLAWCRCVMWFLVARSSRRLSRDFESCLGWELYAFFFFGSFKLRRWAMSSASVAQPVK